MAYEYKSTFGKKNKSSGFVKSLKGIFFLAAVVAPFVAYRAIETTQEVKITGLVGENSRHDYGRVITTGGSYKNENSLLGLKIRNSSEDIQSVLIKGHTYKITSYGGWLFSLFGERNIISAVEVEKGSTPKAPVATQPAVQPAAVVNTAPVAVVATTDSLTTDTAATDSTAVKKAVKKTAGLKNGQ